MKILKSIKALFNPDIDEKLFMMECQKNSLIKDIEKGRKKFTDNEKVIEFATLLTQKLVTNYKDNGKLTTFEEKVLDKALKEGIYRMSFLLLSDMENDANRDDVIKALVSEGFQLIEAVGYVNSDRIVPIIVAPHSF